MVLQVPYLRGGTISSPTASIKMLQTNRGVGKCLCFFCLSLQHLVFRAVPSHTAQKTLERAYTEMDNMLFNTQAS